MSSDIIQKMYYEYLNIKDEMAKIQNFLDGASDTINKFSINKPNSESKIQF